MTSTYWITIHFAFHYTDSTAVTLDSKLDILVNFGTIQMTTFNNNWIISSQVTERK